MAGKRPDSGLSRPQVPSNPLTNRLPSKSAKDKNKLILIRSSHLDMPKESTYSILSKEAVKENKCNNHNPLLDESTMQPRYDDLNVSTAVKAEGDTATSVT